VPLSARLSGWFLRRAIVRVAYIVPKLGSKGGWASACTGILTSLQGRVEPVLFVSSADAPQARELLPRAQVFILPAIQPLVRGPLRMTRALLPSWVALHRLPELHLDLVHSLEMFPTGWIGQQLARRQVVPHVMTAHGTYAILWEKWALLRRAYEAVLREAATICPISQGTADRLRSHFPAALTRVPVEVVLEGTDFARRVPRAVAQDRPWPHPPVILSVGALKPRKGYDLSLRAFALLQRRFPEACYRIAGSGLGSSYHRELTTLIEQEGIRNVEFLGSPSFEGLDSYYRESSLFVLSSREQGLHFEGFGLVFLEAGAYGLPVIGSRTGGIPDAVQDGVTGLLVPAEDIQELARAMEQLVADPALARRLGQGGRKFAEFLTWERYAAQQFGIYERILGPGPDPAPRSPVTIHSPPGGSKGSRMHA
jgi:glycosyltransferase involved in cell wall biosynthesis